MLLSAACGTAVALAIQGVATATMVLGTCVTYSATISGSLTISL
jgi:hypothetical protein